MKTNRFGVTILLAVAAFALAACASGSPKADQATVIKDITVSNNAVVLRQIDLQIEREKTRQKEVDIELAVSGALMTIGQGGDAHSKVVSAVALLGTAKGRGGAGTAPNAQVPQLPPQQIIPPERDLLDRGLQIASVVLPGGVPAVLSPILAANTAAKQIAGQTDQARIAGETTRYQWGAVRDISNGNAAAIQGVVGSAFQFGGEIGRANNYTWNVGGDYAGGNLIGRFSGTGSGASGTQNFGSGILNLGANARIGSPGPYVQPQCTGGDAGVENSNGGAVTCPIQ